jgi:hypothetical protein
MADEVREPIQDQVQPTDDLAIPTFLQRKPLDPVAAEIKAEQDETKRLKARGRIEKMKAKKSGAMTAMPLTGKAALDAIRHQTDDQAETILAENANVIRTLGRRTAEGVIEIGRRLTESKRLCGHGNWLPWLEREFGWGKDQTARNFMQVYEMSLNSQGVGDLSLPLSGR